MTQNGLFTRTPLGSSGFNPGGFRPRLAGPSLGVDFLDLLKGAGDVYSGIKAAEAQEEAAEAAKAQAKALVEAERLRLQQEELRQAGARAAAEDDLIPGVPNVVTFLGGAAVAGAIAWGIFAK